MSLIKDNQIRFILAENYILIDCPRPEIARELTLKLLIETIKKEDLELAPTAERIEGTASDIINYILAK